MAAFPFVLYLPMVVHDYVVLVQVDPGPSSCGHWEFVGLSTRVDCIPIQLLSALLENTALRLFSVIVYPYRGTSQLTAWMPSTIIRTGCPNPEFFIHD